LTIEFHKEK